MNDYVEKITLDLNCQATPVVISAGQFDVGRKILITLTADGEAYDATGATAVCKGRSGDNHFAVEAVISNNTVTVTTDKAMLSSAGRTIAKIVLTDGTRTYSTQPFVINTHSDYDGNITASDYYPILMDIINRVIALTESGAVLTDTALNADSINPVQNKVLTPIINGKADKATTLAGYGITDTYTKEVIDNSLGKKLIAMPFDDVPKQSSPCYITSGAVYAALLVKANASDVYSKIAANQTFVTRNKGSVITALIADGAVTAEKLANGSVTAEKLETACVGFDELATNSVSTGHICDGAVTVEKLGEDATTAINSKADKATTLAGYGITDAYTKEIIDNKLSKKLVAMPFDSEPKIKSPCYITSGAVYAALIAKANASDVYSKDVANKTFIMNNSGVITTALIADGAVTAEKLGEDVTAAINDKAGQSKVSQIDSRLQSVELYIKNKVNNSTFSAAIAQKYDSSNVETGSGNLTPAQEAYEGCEGSFSYSKVGSTVMVSLKINALLTGKNYVQLAGLPYRAITASKLSSMAAYTTNNKLVNLRIDGAWLYVFYPVGTFADGEKINATITYITN